MIKIYGKPQCPYFDRAKALCEQNDYEYIYNQLDVEFTRDELFEMFPQARTFPQIFINGNPIGGFQEFQQVLDLNERRNNI